MNGMAPAALVLLLLWAGQEKKQPPPDAATEKRAEREVREVFKAEYAKKAPAERTALFQLLLSQGLQTKDDPAARFVLLREARDVAAENGDVRGALRAVDELARSFSVEARAMRAATLAPAVRGARTPEDFQTVTEACLVMADDAAFEEDYETAERCAAEAGGAAKKSKVLALVLKADAKAKEIAERKAFAGTLKKARQTLAAAPEDADANLVAGRYECLQRGLWDSGLPMLAKGSDPVLRDLAAKDLSKPADAEEQAALGDRWWELAEKQPAAGRALLRQRAAFWYAQAAPRTAGLTRAKLESRLKEGQATAAIDLLQMIDPKKDSIRGGWELEGTSLVCVRPEAAARVQIPFIPPDEYDVTVVAERLAGVEAINIGLVKDGIKFHMVVDGWATQGYFSGLSKVDQKYGNENETSRPGPLLTNNRPSTVECSVRNSGLSMRVDGKLIFQWSGDVKRLSNYVVLDTPNPRALYISAWDSRYRFSKITLTPVSGAGEKLR